MDCRSGFMLWTSGLFNSYQMRVYGMYLCVWVRLQRFGIGKLFWLRLVLRFPSKTTAIEVPASV